MKRNKILLIAVISALATFLALDGFFTVLQTFKPSIQAQSVAIKPVESQISANGTIHSESEATLQFQTPGKLVYLPFKQGDKVSQGQTIAQLDTYALQRSLTTALNNYKSTRDTFDQTVSNSSNTILQGQQKYVLDVTGKSGITGDSENNAINDMVARIVDQNQSSLNNSVINVELASYALQLATLTSPISGVITAEDVTVPNVNITTNTSFSVADPSLPIFKAYVLPQDIDFVQVGSPAKITIDGLPNLSVSGSVERVFPQKTTLSDGSSAYEVDITSDNLKNGLKLGQTGHVFIQSTARSDSMLVPIWAVVANQYVWMTENGRPVLQKVVVGKTHGNDIEISGLGSPDQKIILDPKNIADQKYKVL